MCVCVCVCLSVCKGESHTPESGVNDKKTNRGKRNSDPNRVAK